MTSAISVRAAAIPDTPVAPTTAINGNNVDFAWTAPYNGGSPITAYTVTIRHGDGTSYSVDLVNCDGSSAGILSSATC